LSQQTKATHHEKYIEGMALILQDSSRAERAQQDSDKCNVIANNVPSKGLLNGLVARVTRVAEINVAGLQHAQLLEPAPNMSTLFSAAVNEAHML
jgi:hypothetical protein